MAAADVHGVLEYPATIAVTAVELFVAAIAVGAVAGELWILPAERPNEAAVVARARAVLQWWLGIGLLLFTLCQIIELILRACEMSDLGLLDVFPALTTVLLKTHYGHQWLGRGAALLLWWGAWVLRRRTGARAASCAGALAATCIAATISGAGHAGDDGLWTAGNLAISLHVIGGLLWGGGIVAMTAVILPVLVHRPPVARRLLALTGQRLSTLATVALGLVILPGFYGAYLQIDSWRALWATSYGEMLMLKVLLVTGMVCLGAGNHFLFVPALQRVAAGRVARVAGVRSRSRAGLGGIRPLHGFRDSIRIEALLLIAVLSLAGALSQQTPARDAIREGPAAEDTGAL